MAATFPPRASVVEGLIASGSKTLFGGPPKAGKSWMLMDLAVCVSRGLPWLGFPTKAGRVLYIDFELQPADIQMRLDAVRTAYQLMPGDLNGLQFVPHWGNPPDDPDTFAGRLHTWAGSDGPIAMVIIDPIYRLGSAVQGMGYDDPTLLLGALSKFCKRTDAAIVLACHYPKGDPRRRDNVDRVAGSSIWARDADGILTVTPTRGNMSATLEASLRLYPAQPRFLVKWESPLMMRQQGPAPDPQSFRGQRRAKYTESMLLELVPQDGTTAKSALSRAAKKKHDMSASTVERLMRSLLESGELASDKQNVWRSVPA